MLTMVEKEAVSQDLVRTAKIFDNESPGYQGGWLKKMPGTDQYIHWWFFRIPGERYWFPLFERLITPIEKWLSASRIRYYGRVVVFSGTCSKPEVPAPLQPLPAKPA